MNPKEFSRRDFLGAVSIISTLSFAGIVAACTTTKTEDQKIQKDRLATLRAEKKYKEKNITVGDNYYSPKETTIDAGTIVVWTNKGESIHDIMDDDAMGDMSNMKNVMKDFSSDVLRHGDIHVALFDKPGTYFYHCHFHGSPKTGQWGSITVSSTGHTP